MNQLRCATVARDEGLDPLGTAGHHDGFLLVEWPLPWPHDLGDVEALQPLVAALAGTGVRLQGLVPGAGDERRVVLYRRPAVAANGSAGTNGSGGANGANGPAGFSGYERVERRTAPAEVLEQAIALVTAPPRQADPPAPGGDVLICTHGRRDACCGRQGTALVMEVATDPRLAAAGYRVSRTSHTGGHRFAPTAVLLPEGTMWAFLDADLTSRIVLREGPVDAVLDHYRGSTGIGSPALQAVERAAFAEVGWDWLGWRRHGEQLVDGRVRVVGEAPDGARWAWAAEVGERARPVPVCGEPIDAAVKQQREPIVVSLERTPSPV